MAKIISTKVYVEFEFSKLVPNDEPVRDLNIGTGPIMALLEELNKDDAFLDAIGESGEILTEIRISQPEQS